MADIHSQPAKLVPLSDMQNVCALFCDGDTIRAKIAFVDPITNTLWLERESVETVERVTIPNG